MNAPQARGPTAEAVEAYSDGRQATTAPRTNDFELKIVRKCFGISSSFMICRYLTRISPTGE
jgi:hypothetical protein